jgi:hypothetical protein
LNDTVAFTTVAQKRYGKGNRKTDKPEDLPEQEKLNPHSVFHLRFGKKAMKCEGIVPRISNFFPDALWFIKIICNGLALCCGGTAKANTKSKQ